jgi:uncharacterized membrane protein
LGNFDPSALLPNISFTFGLITLLARLAILVVPALLLAFGALYFFKPVKEPSRKSGYRTIFAIKDPEAWRFVQRLAGLVYLALGGVMMLSMIIVSIVLIGKETMSLLTTAAICLVINAVLTALAVISINIYMIIRHHRKNQKPAQRNPQRAPQRTPQRAPQRVPQTSQRTPRKK